MIYRALSRHFYQLPLGRLHKCGTREGQTSQSVYAGGYADAGYSTAVQPKGTKLLRTLPGDGIDGSSTTLVNTACGLMMRPAAVVVRRPRANLPHVVSAALPTEVLPSPPPHLITAGRIPRRSNAAVAVMTRQCQETPATVLAFQPTVSRVAQPRRWKCRRETRQLN